MSFRIQNRTGKKKTEACFYCGREVTYIEYKDNKAGKFYKPSVHKAPCGAYCMGGGVKHGEENVHCPPFKACPKCGEVDSIKVFEILKYDRLEKISFYKYTKECHADIGYRIEKELFENGNWVVKTRLPTNNPESLEGTVKWAETYFSWLKNA